jgi:hypothetical protein
METATVSGPRICSRKQFFREPVVGFPRLWWRLIRDSNALIAASSKMTATQQTLT